MLLSWRGVLSVYPFMEGTRNGEWFLLQVTSTCRNSGLMLFNRIFFTKIHFWLCSPSPKTRSQRWTVPNVPKLKHQAQKMSLNHDNFLSTHVILTKIHEKLANSHISCVQAFKPCVLFYRRTKSSTYSHIRQESIIHLSKFLLSSKAIVFFRILRDAFVPWRSNTKTLTNPNRGLTVVLVFYKHIKVWQFHAYRRKKNCFEIAKVVTSIRLS